MSDHLTASMDFQQALLAADRVRLWQTVAGLEKDPAKAREFVERSVVPALAHMGEEWEAGRIALSQVYMGGRLCEELVDALLPPASPVRKHQPRMAIAVLEDYHFLGKRIVYASLRASGWELEDYGRVEAEGLVALVQRDRIEVLLISTLMLASALRIRQVRSGLERAGQQVRLVVGGAPFRFDAQLWSEVGADATSASAAGVLPILDQLLEGGR